MAFFDLNVPYLEKDAAASQDNAAKKAVRLKVVVKAMELGYTGVAYDRQIRGVMSDKDRCRIAPFPLSSLLKAAPTLAASVNFHRELVGVPASSPFRQYTRLTVAVDNPVHAGALNSGNPVLKSYDLVAVKPLNQVAFDHACKVSEVDLIAVDFCQKLPFRLKLPMVKAAIERGVYFEVVYSHFLSRADTRKEMLPNAKLLVNWTRGRNLIFSSAAPTASEVRGPYDVANLSSLFGLSNEQAKAALSKNCRFLLDKALKKKRCYKEVIKVERLSPGEQLKSSESLLNDWRNWDPISSGEGDLPPPHDFAKYFADLSKAPKCIFSADQISVQGDVPVENMIPYSQRSFLSQELHLSCDHATEKPSSLSTTLQPLNLHQPSDIVAAEQVPFSVGLCDIECDPPVPQSNPVSVLASTLETEIMGKGEISDVSPDGIHISHIVPMESVCDVSLENGIFHECLSSGFTDGVLPSSLIAKELMGSDSARVTSAAAGSLSGSVSVVDCTVPDRGHHAQSNYVEERRDSSMDIDSFLLCDQNASLSNEHNVEFVSNDLEAGQDFSVAEQSDKKGLDRHRCDALQQECLSRPMQNKQEDETMPAPEHVLAEEGFDECKEQNQLNLAPNSIEVPLDQDREQTPDHPTSSNIFSPSKRKQVGEKFTKKRRHTPFPFPSKSFLKPLLFKKKIHPSKCSRNNLVRTKNDYFS